MLKGADNDIMSNYLPCSDNVDNKLFLAFVCLHSLIHVKLFYGQNWNKYNFGHKVSVVQCLAKYIQKFNLI